MISRRLENTVREALAYNSTTAILGPRQVGKTTIALNIAEHVESVYLDLESQIDLEKVRDIIAFHSDNRDKLIILDEVQRLPEVFSQLRGIIDKERRAGNKTGQFLFLGSASMDLLQQSSESLAGRITYLELHPIDTLEYAQESVDKMNTLWVRGGFPDGLLSFDDKRSLNWRRSFIKTYLERDIPKLGPQFLQRH